MTHPRTERSQYFVGLPSGAVPVSPEVYHAWYSGARQERYQQERDHFFGVTSFSSLSDEENDILEVLPSAQCTELEVEQREMHQSLYSALKQLPEKEKQVLYDIYFHGSTRAQIAQQKGVSETAIRKREHRALKRMKNFL